MQKSFEIEQGIPEIWGFKGLEMILLRETKKEEKIPLWMRCAIYQRDRLWKCLCAPVFVENLPILAEQR